MLDLRVERFKEERSSLFSSKEKKQIYEIDTRNKFFIDFTSIFSVVVRPIHVFRFQFGQKNFWPIQKCTVV